MAHLDAAQLRRHHRRNLVETVAVFVGILVWLGLVGWLVLDWQGLMWALLAGAVMLWFQPVRSTALLKAMYGAQPLGPAEAPGLYRVLADLCARAEIRRLPAVLYIPRREVVALSTGSGDDTAIAVSDGLLRHLPPRELVAVLSHELAHLRHGDLKLLRMADTAGRLTRTLSLVGLLLAIFYLPVVVSAGASVSMAPLLLLVAAPIVSDLMTFKLSRSREFGADWGAAALTGDPQGLILALERIDRIQSGGWERLTRLPGWRWLSWVRSHPTTGERIGRLEQLMPAPESMWANLSDILPPAGTIGAPTARRWPWSRRNPWRY